MWGGFRGFREEATGIRPFSLRYSRTAKPCQWHPGDRSVEMKQVNAGSLRAIGYDPGQRVLRVEMTNGSLMEYSGVSEDTWRRFAGSGSQWSFFRDNIEENYTERRVR